MLRALQQFFDQHGDTRPASNPEQELQVATAAILMELIKADYAVDDIELSHYQSLLKAQFGLDQQQLTELMAIVEQEVANATSLYPFTHLINANYSEAQKYQLICNLWQIAYADGNIDKYEDAFIRQTAELLYIPHRKFIQAKLAMAPNAPGDGS